MEREGKAFGQDPVEGLQGEVPLHEFSENQVNMRHLRDHKWLRINLLEARRLLWRDF